MRKTTVRIFAATMAILLLALTLVACGATLSGTYSAEVAGTGKTYAFKGNKVTISYKFLGTEVYSYDGTYKIEDDQITITIDSDDKDAKDLKGTFDFEKTDDGIKIGIVTYKKQ